VYACVSENYCLQSETSVLYHHPLPDMFFYILITSKFEIAYQTLAVMVHES